MIHYLKLLSEGILVIERLSKKTMRHGKWNHTNSAMTYPWKIFQTPSNINTSYTTRQVANK